jgi:hypothetical protein
VEEPNQKKRMNRRKERKKWFFYIFCTEMASNG